MQYAAAQPWHLRLLLPTISMHFASALHCNYTHTCVCLLVLLAAQLMGRRADVRSALDLLASHTSFAKDAKVHLFEVVIRMLGGLLSGHTLLSRDPNLVLGYDGALLSMATDLMHRLLPAFNTTSGLPSMFVNLEKVIGSRMMLVACFA
jgi:hypothetical protein